MRNFLSKNVYVYILNLISFHVTTKTIFAKCEGGTILKPVDEGPKGYFFGFKMIKLQKIIGNDKHDKDNVPNNI